MSRSAKWRTMSEVFSWPDEISGWPDKSGLAKKKKAGKNGSPLMVFFGLEMWPQSDIYHHSVESWVVLVSLLTKSGVLELLYIVVLESRDFPA